MKLNPKNPKKERNIYPEATCADCDSQSQWDFFCITAAKVPHKNHKKKNTQKESKKEMYYKSKQQTQQNKTITKN